MEIRCNRGKRRSAVAFYWWSSHSNGVAQAVTGHLSRHSSLGKTGSEPFTLHELAGSQPATLSRISGTFQIPATGSYRLFCMAGPGGYVLLDGQLIATFRGAKSGRLFEIEIDNGQHRLEILQYAPTGQVGWAGLWWKDPWKDFNGDYGPKWPKFGDGSVYAYLPVPPYMLWEPMADATAAPLEHREPLSWATFSWYQHAHLGAVSPAHDLNWVLQSCFLPFADPDPGGFALG